MIANIPIGQAPQAIAYVPNAAERSRREAVMRLLRTEAARPARENERCTGLPVEAQTEPFSIRRLSASGDRSRIGDEPERRRRSPDADRAIAKRGAESARCCSLIADSCHDDGGAARVATVGVPRAPRGALRANTKSAIRSAI